MQKNELHKAVVTLPIFLSDIYKAVCIPSRLQSIVYVTGVHSGVRHDWNSRITRVGSSSVLVDRVERFRFYLLQLKPLPSL